MANAATANANPSSIDDVVNQQMAAQNSQHATASANTSGLENKIHETQKEDTGWTFKQVAKDVLKYSPIAAFNWLVSGGLAYLSGGTSFLASASTFFAPFGYAIARYILNKREKKKTTWYDIRKELVTGNFVGIAAYWLYQVPELLIKYLGINTSTLFGKVAKTLTFNPGMLIPFVAMYQPAIYMRDNIGTKKTLQGLYNGKIFGYMKEAYQKGMKGQYLKTLTKTWLTLFPSHLATIGFNLVKLPSLRVGIGAIHDIIFALIAGSKKNEQTAAEKEKVPFSQKINSAYQIITSPRKLLTNLDNFFRTPDYVSPFQANYAGAYA